MRWAGHIACIGEIRNSYKILVGMPEGKRPVRRPRRIWEHNIKGILRKQGWNAWAGFIWLKDILGTGGELL
jgi:hypothetical protein